MQSCTVSFYLVVKTDLVYLQFKPGAREELLFYEVVARRSVKGHILNTDNRTWENMKQYFDR